MDVQRGYEPDWLGNTFSIAVFLGNGLVAIVSGLLAHGLVEVRAWHCQNDGLPFIKESSNVGKWSGLGPP